MHSASLYARQPGKPQTIAGAFSVLNTHTQYMLHIDNNGVSSAVVSVNGAQVFGPSDFAPNGTSLDRAITLATDNTVAVELRSKPGTSLTVTVIGVDSDPPSIAEFAAPPSNAFGWNNTDVGVSFTCGDATSGIAICPNPLVLATEGLNQVVAGTAFDRAGNSATSSIQISIDRTPPTIAASQAPPPNAFNWNKSAVTVSFICADSLSGVASCPSPETVSSEGANQPVSGTSIDKAGNSASASLNLNIDLTPPVLAITLPVDGSTVTVASLSVSGTVADALSGVSSVQCNGVSAPVSSGTFLCQVTLNPGSNTLQITATDVAGNQASSSRAVTFQAAPPVPINAIFITPGQMNLLTGQTRALTVVSDQGQPVHGATLTISDPTVLQISGGQISALQAGTVTITASLEGHTASATVQVFSGTQLPLGTPLWTNSPLPGNQALGGVFADNRSGTGPDIYSLERVDATNLVVRALSSDGRQLWTTPIPADSLQPQIATSAAASGGPRNFSTVGVAGNATGANDLQSVLEKMRSAGGISAVEADFVSGTAKDIIFSPVEQRRKAAVDMAARLGQPVAQGLSAPGATTGTRADAPSSIIILPFVPFTFFVEQAPDPQGGLLVHLTRIMTDETSKDSLVRIDPVTQRMSWSYDTDFMNGNFAVRDDGTIFALKFFVSYFVERIPGTNFAVKQPETTGDAYVGVDLLTGAEKFSMPAPGEFILQDVLGDIVFECPCIRSGPIAIDQDGNAQVTYAARTITFPNFVLGATTSITTVASTLNQLTLDGTGGSSTQPLKNLTSTATTFSASDGTVLRTIVEPHTFIFPAETIPDGTSGLLDAWTLETVQGIDCVFPAPFQPQCTRTGSSGFDARITHGASEYSLQPLDGFFDPGASLVLGNGNTAFAFNGPQLTAFQTDTGLPLWSAQVPTSHFNNKLIAATQEGGVLVNLDAGHLALFDLLGNPTVFGTFTFFLSDINPDGSLLGLNDVGTQVLQPAIASLASSLWQDAGGNHRRRAPVPAQITSLSKSREVPGVTIEVRLKGTQLKQIVSIDAGPGIKVSFDQFRIATDTILPTLFAIDPSATPGMHKVTATLKNGKTIVSKQDFFVQIPTSLKGAQLQNSDPNLATDSSGAAPLQTPTDGPVITLSGVPLTPDSHRCGVYRNYAFQLMDQDSPPQPINDSYHAAENLSGWTPACIQANADQCPSLEQIDSNEAGIISDTHSITHSAGVCLALNENRSVQQSFTVTTGNNSYNLKTTCAISLGNFAGTLNETTSCKDSQ
ncbi:MAG TPA: hypothetical protein VNW97_20175 [Candidatus Saccharimonadales bacterium]|nr:hypothetical protein [Candidatus Saccharimonadales bacterium]